MTPLSIFLDAHPHRLSDLERVQMLTMSGEAEYALWATLNSYGHGWSRSSSSESVPSIPSSLSGLVSEDSELARAAFATFVALILDCTLRSEVVEGILL